MKIVWLEDGDIVVSRGSFASRGFGPLIGIVSFWAGAFATSWYYTNVLGL